MNPTRLVLALLCFALPQMVQARVELVIYTYQSMVSKWGPGQKLKYAFEKNCKCQVRYVGLDDGVALLNRLILEGKQTQSDVILGLDQFIMGELQEKKLVDRHQLTLPELTIPWDHQSFIPFDYGYFTFIYNRKKLPNPPNSLQQ